MIDLVALRHEVRWWRKITDAACARPTQAIYPDWIPEVLRLRELAVSGAKLPTVGDDEAACLAREAMVFRTHIALAISGGSNWDNEAHGWPA